MTRREYFERMRAALLEVNDRERGVFILFHPGYCGPKSGTPHTPSACEVHERLFPQFTADVMNQPVGATFSARSIQRLVEYRDQSDAPTKPAARAAYEALVLAIGQQVRDLITDDPTALWNVYEQRRRELEPRVQQALQWAVQAETTAVRTRATACELQHALAEIEAEQARLTAAAAEKTVAAQCGKEEP